MLNIKVSLSIYLETRTPKKDGTFPVKLRVTHKRKRKYYALNLSMTKERYDRIFSDRPRGKDYDQKLEFNELEKQAYEIIKQIPVFSFELFEIELFGKGTDENKNDVYASYDNYIRTLKDNEQFGTSEAYGQSKNSLIQFSKRKKLIFEEITPEFLTKYEKWQIERGKSPTTISIYLRCLRKLFNSAIADGVIEQKAYPFGRNKYLLPASKNIKKALTMSEISQIYNYDTPKGSTEEYARDIWMFSYLCNGMNIADLARLKYEQIDESKITFIREKTKRTSKHNSQVIVVGLLPEAMEVIKRWGNQDTPSNYIFPIIKKMDDKEQQRKRIKQFTKTVNKYMKRIVRALEINKPVTTYAARHSFSTILKKSGAPTELISEQLGHSSILTTRAYLDSFDEDFKMKYMNELTAFKKEEES